AAATPSGEARFVINPYFGGRMFDAFELSPSTPRLPAWLARDLGVHPSTLLSVPRHRRRDERGATFTRILRRQRADGCLATVPLFETLPKRTRRRAVALSSMQTFPAGTMLTQQGAIGDEFFLLLDGHVEVYRSGTVVAREGPGTPLGEVALLE